MDELVAEAIGYSRGTDGVYVSGEAINGYFIGGRWFSNIPNFSTEWEDMGVLVEESRKQGIYIDILSNETCYISEAKTMSNVTIGKSTKSEAPHAACLAFLAANGIAI
ncbi:hypothetical protein P9578_03585 [Brevibacillus choshinensis]|uniref:hypothetical protein n=1 Tax=Brevibacillus choshinensis TaxID=54911 RepID=UPI002E2221C9|nr:hypothetical protein [Brevibacillus choshinensis]